jgi:hypothetical protein
MTRREQDTRARWRHGLAQLQAYTAAHGAATPPTHEVLDGFRLGRWAARQRERYWAHRLPPDHITALQGVPGWDWGRTNADRWSEGLTHLRSYLDEHGSTAVDTHTVHEGFELGAWVARRRANYHQGTLSPHPHHRVGGVGGVGVDPRRRPLAPWPDSVAYLQHPVRHRRCARGYPPPPLPAGCLGDRRRAQYQRGTLPPGQVTTLQALPGWVWDVKTSRWDQGLRLLTAYAHRTGVPNPHSFYLEAAEDNFTLGQWAMSRRKEYRLGILSPTRIAALEAIDGWEWNPYDAAWWRMFTHLEQAAHHHGSVAHITQTTVIDGVNIGHWVMAQRTRHRQDRLAPDRVNALQALPGWDWAPHAHPRPPPATPNLPPSDS